MGVQFLLVAIAVLLLLSFGNCARLLVNSKELFSAPRKMSGGHADVAVTPKPVDQDEGQDIAEYAVMLAVILVLVVRHDSTDWFQRQ